ncbi:hypothetical protein Tco_0963682, partial [Tanacetum coccineum]
MKTKNKAVKRKLPFDYESASNKMTDIISKPLVVRKIAETNGNTINIPACTCGDAKTSIRTHLQHPCCPGISKRTQFPTTANRTSTINGNNVVAKREGTITTMSLHPNYLLLATYADHSHAHHPTVRNSHIGFLIVTRRFLEWAKLHGFRLSGSAIRGSKAMYADLGHFSKLSIKVVFRGPIATTSMIVQTTPSESSRGFIDSDTQSDSTIALSPTLPSAM